MFAHRNFSTFIPPSQWAVYVTLNELTTGVVDRRTVVRPLWKIEFALVRQFSNQLKHLLECLKNDTGKVD